MIASPWLLVVGVSAGRRDVGDVAKSPGRHVVVDAHGDRDRDGAADGERRDRARDDAGGRGAAVRGAHERRVRRQRVGHRALGVRVRAVILDHDRVREQVAWGGLGVVHDLDQTQIGVGEGKCRHGQKAAHGHQQHEHAAHPAPGIRCIVVSWCRSSGGPAAGNWRPSNPSRGPAGGFGGPGRFLRCRLQQPRPDQVGGALQPTVVVGRRISRCEWCGGERGGDPLVRGVPVERRALARLAARGADDFLHALGRALLSVARARGAADRLVHERAAEIVHAGVEQRAGAVGAEFHPRGLDAR